MPLSSPLQEAMPERLPKNYVFVRSSYDKRLVSEKT